MRYAVARYEHEQRETAYRFYVAESFYASGNGKHLTQSFMDIYQKIGKPADKRSSEQIIGDSLEYLGIKVI